MLLHNFRLVSTFFFLCLFCALFTTADCKTSVAASVRGHIFDQTTREPLPGARIAVVGTPRGTLSGLDGSFHLTVENDTKITLRITCSGYKSVQRDVVATGDVTLEIELPHLSGKAEEVIVSTTTDQGSDLGSLKTVQRSENVINAVSARSIEVSPDLSVADVSQRMSGVSIARSSNGDGQYAIIRGMDKRYNYTTVNGIKIPSPDNKNRYVPLDIFPSELLERLEVTKSLLPTMEGDAIGGAMNMVMKQAPDHQIASAKIGSGYDALFLSRKFYTYDFSSSAVSPRVAKGPAYNATLADFPLSNFNPHPVDPAFAQYYSATYGNRFLEDQQFGVVVSGSYQRSARGANSLFFATTADQQTNMPALTDENNRIYSTLQTRAGVMANLDYRLSETSKLQLFGMYADLQSQQVRDEFDSILGLSWPQTIRIPYQRRATLTQQGIGNVTLTGTHQIFGKDLEAKWDLVFSKAALNVPDRSQLDLYGGVDRNPDGSYTAEQTNVNLGSTRRWSSNVDQDKTAYLTLKTTEDIFSLPTEFSYGGMYRMKDRTSSFDEYNLRPNNQFTIQRFNGNVSTDTFFVFNPQGTSDDPLNYTAHENVSAGFLQAKFQIGNVVTIGGVRVENTDFGWITTGPKTMPGRTGAIQYLDILPSVSFKYSPVENQNWRLSYFRSISRPGFYEVIPNNGVPGEDYTETTNPYLNRTQASNIDARWECFPGALDQVLVGAFYKNIQDPIEYTVVEVGTNTFLEPQNFGTAINYGFEIDLRKYFSIFGVQANYTFTHSTITTDKKVNYVDPKVGITYRVEQQTRPLQGQSAHIGNLSLLYKDFVNGTDAQLGLVYTGEAIVSVSPNKDDDIWQKAIVQLDCSVEQTLFGGIAVYLKINNILNTPREEVIHQTYTQPGATPISYQTPGQDVLIRREYYDRTYLLGFRYKL